MNSKKNGTKTRLEYREYWSRRAWNPDKLVGSIGHEGKYEGTERTTQVGLKGYVMRA